MAEAVSKAQFIDSVADQAGLSKSDAEAAVKAYHDVVTKILAAGDSVTFVGFGTYKTSERAARDGRNPKTGETIRIAASTVAKFSAGKRLKDAVNGK